MAQRHILKQGDPVLQKKCREVTDFNSRLHTLLDDMKETLSQANGVGLAAPQVGVLRRAVIVLETNVDEGEEEYMIELVN
ncbi:MAG: peptide deformylase, partial [Clostridia bacterium]|nr:peptide deformylase [Clostridia bacterium]